MRLKEIAKDAFRKVGAISRKPDQEKGKKAEAAGKMIREAADKAGKMTTEAMIKNGAIIGSGLVAGECRTEELDLEEARKAFASAGYDMDEVSKALRQIAETIVEVMRPIVEVMRPIVEEWKRIGLDKWQIAKMEMPNNERRRKGLPMIRRRGHIRAEQLQRRRKK